MKKILLAVTAALAITGCSQNEEFEAPSQKAEINFNTAVTRAAELNTDGLKTTGFEVYTYNTGTIAMTAETVLPTDVWMNGHVSYANSKWTVEGGPYYWPLTDYLQFFAYSPKDGVVYTAPNGAKGYPKFTYTVGTTATLQKDLVIASVQDTKKKNGTASDISLTFKHALTQINIEVTKEPGYTYTVSKVELTGLKGSGEFTYTGVNTGTWTAGTETNVSYAYELGAFTDDNKTAVTDGNALMLIPQALTDVNISIEYIVEKNGSQIAENSKKVSLASTTAWDFGKKILYKLTLPVGAEDISLSATVSDWDAEDPVTPTVD